MRYLVTGAAGFIGSHTVEMLLAQGHEVVGIDSFDDFYPTHLKERNVEEALRNDRYRLVRGDLREPSVLHCLDGRFDAVVHLAARAGVRPSIEQPILYGSVNLQGLLELLEWMIGRKVPSLLFASSSSVYGNADQVPFREDQDVGRPISPYAATKRAGELLCHTYHHLHGLSVLALRFFTVYGPRQRPDLAIHKFTRLIRDGRAVPMFGDGSTERDYTYIDDIQKGIRAALDYMGRSEPVYEIVNLGESRTVSLAFMIEHLAEELGIRPEIEYLPMQPGDVVRTYADISKARRLLGYDPITSFEEGVSRFVRWYDRVNDVPPAGRVS